MTTKSGTAKTKRTVQMPERRYRPEVLEVVSRLLADDPRVKRTQMFGHPSFATGGKMFASLYDDGIAVKLPLDRAEALIGGECMEAFVPGGMAKMRGWVLIRRTDAEAFTADEPLLREALTYVAGEAQGV